MCKDDDVVGTLIEHNFGLNVLMPNERMGFHWILLSNSIE
jgi:hypothetical protein